MKKIYILIGVLLVAGAIALVYYINKRPAKPTISETTTPEQGNSATPRDHGADTNHVNPTPHVQPKEPLTPEAEAQKTRAINDFVSRSQIDRDFEKAAEMLKGMSEHLRPDEQKSMQKFIDKLSGPEIIDEYKKMLAERFNQQELERLSEIYSDKEVLLLQEAGRKAATPEGQKEISKHLKTFDIDKVPADRKEALRGIIENQMKSFEGAMPDMTDAQRKDYQSFQAEQRDAMVGELDAILKDRSTDQLTHLGSMTGDKVFELEQQTRAKLLFQQMMMAEQGVMQD